MFRLLKNRRLLIALFIGMIAIVSILIYANFNWLARNWTSVVTVLSLLVGVSGWIKDNPKVFMFFAQCKALVFSGQTRWNLSANYVVDNPDPHLFAQVKNNLKRMGNKRQIFGETQSSIRLSVDGLNLSVSISNDGDTLGLEECSARLHVQIFEYHAPYHETISLLRNTFIPLFESLEKDFHARQRRYGLSMFFGRENPFYGLYFQHLELKNILDFRCIVEEKPSASSQFDEQEACKVTISKDRLDFSSLSLNQLQNITEKYLAVSWG